MKKLLIGIGIVASVVGAQGQGYFNPATRGTAGGAANDAPAVLLNYYKGAVFTYTYKGSNYVVNDHIGFIPGTTAANNMQALGNANAGDSTAVFNLGPIPTAGTNYQAALYIGAKGETDVNKYVRAGSNAWFSTGAAPGYLLSSSGAGVARRTTGSNSVSGLTLTFQTGEEMSAQIRAWISSPGTPKYDSWEEFMAQVAFGGGGQAGYAGMTAPQNTKAGAAAPITGFSGLQGTWFLYPVPEPSVVGLGLLGLAGLFFIRRRK